MIPMRVVLGKYVFTPSEMEQVNNKQTVKNDLPPQLTCKLTAFSY